MAKRTKKRRICVLTGTRAEYGLLKSLLDAIDIHPTLELDLVVTGIHLIRDFGHTVDDIVRDGWDVSLKIPIYSGKDRREELPGALAKLTSRLGSHLLKHRCDFIVLLGDRLEVLGGASAAMTAGVPIAHIHGGEVAPGDMDDRIRYAVSSMANIHFAASAESKRRLIRTGQDPKSIFTVGAIGLDHIFQMKKRWHTRDRAGIRAEMGFTDDGPIIMCIYHPCGFGAEGERAKMTAILDAAAPYQGIIIGPNTDPGHSGVTRAIRTFMKNRKHSSRWQFVASLDRDMYLQAVWVADVVLGNSSSGILEVNALNTAVVNVGPRQQGRQRNGNTVFDCTYSKTDIRKALRIGIDRTRNHVVRPSKAFGNGQTGAQIAEILASVPADRSLLLKSFT